MWQKFKIAFKTAFPFLFHQNLTVNDRRVMPDLEDGEYYANDLMQEELDKGNNIFLGPGTFKIRELVDIPNDDKHYHVTGSGNFETTIYNVIPSEEPYNPA